MKYEVRINFYVLSKSPGLIERMQEEGITNDDMAIFDYIRYCCTNRESKLSRIYRNKTPYYWISYQLIIDAIPLLGKMRKVNGKYVWKPWSRSTVLRSVTKLHNVGLIVHAYSYEKVRRSKDGRQKTFYAIPKEINILYWDYEKHRS